MVDEGKLITALENEGNVDVLALTSGQITSQINNILQRLQLPRQILGIFHKKLKGYRYCAEVEALRHGWYIRWISLRDAANLRLTNGGHICRIDRRGDLTHIVCRNNCRKLFQVVFEEALLFQRLSMQEQVILKVMNCLS